MKSPRIAQAFLLALIAIGGPACAATTPPQSSPNQQVSMTRSMLVFFQLEQDLSGAVSKHDQGATDKLLSVDFELRPDSHPGEATTRAEWLADGGSQSGSRFEHLGVRDFGDVAIVSFVMTTKNGADSETRSYVVDAWKKQGDGWQLITRYQSKLPVATNPDEDRVPTGKG
jgi:ketosteroid isomerase-like protein